METSVEITENMASDNQGLNCVENASENAVETKTSMDEKSRSQTNGKKTIKKAKDGKRNKEEEKRIKLLMRAFDGLESNEAKLEALAKKYVQLASEHKTVEHRKDELESRNEKLTKERDTLQSDYNKATLAKSKLESLCRELQRHSKLVKEECQLRAQEEETKRKELSDRFQTTINDISQQMQDNFKRNEQLKVENEELAQKLKGLVDQYESREEHVDKVFKHKHLELQLAEAKMAQQNLQFNEMKEKSLIEKQELLKDSLDYRKKYEIMIKQENELRAQLKMYTEKFDEFQSTLNKSNEVFVTFKKEMDKMNKTIKKLEKENKTWKSRWENTNRSLLDMLDERTNMDKERVTLRARNDKLENLCRAMQKERLVSKQPSNEIPLSVDTTTSATEHKAIQSQQMTTDHEHTQGVPTPSNGSTESQQTTADHEPTQGIPTPSNGSTESHQTTDDHEPTQGIATPSNGSTDSQQTTADHEPTQGIPTRSNGSTESQQTTADHEPTQGIPAPSNDSSESRRGTQDPENTVVESQQETERSQAEATTSGKDVQVPSHKEKELDHAVLEEEELSKFSLSQCSESEGIAVGETIADHLRDLKSRDTSTTEAPGSVDSVNCTNLPACESGDSINPNGVDITPE